MNSYNLTEKQISILMEALTYYQDAFDLFSESEKELTGLWSKLNRCTSVEITRS